MAWNDFRSLQATYVPKKNAPGQGRLYFWCMPPKGPDYARRALAALGVLRRGKFPPMGKAELVIPTPTRNKTEDWEIAELTAIRPPLLETLRGLATLDMAQAERRRVSDSLRVWSLASKLALELIAHGHIVPLLDRTEKDDHHARWAVTALSSEDRARIQRIEELLPIAGHCLVLDEGKPSKKRRRRKTRRRRKRKPVTSKTTIHPPRLLVRSFLDAVADSFCRDALPATSKDRPKKDNREFPPWELRWRFSLCASDPSFESAGLVERTLPDQIARWAAPVKPRTRGGTAYSVGYQLEQPGTAPETDGMPGVWYMRFLLQANDDPSIVVDGSEVWSTPERHATFFGRKFELPHETLLQSLAETARVFPPIERALRSSKPAGVALSTEEAWEFIARVGPILLQFGVPIRVPRGLRSDGRQRLRLKLYVGDHGDGKPSKVGIQSLAAFRWQVALGEHELSPEEFREIASMKQPLVQWRGQWMAVDPSELSEMEQLFTDAQAKGTMDRSAALAAALSGSIEGQGAFRTVEVVAEGGLRGLVDAIREQDEVEPIDTPDGFHGELRPYQSRGLTWLSYMTDLGFGVCLADDMGLGKTIQVIAHLLHLAESDEWGDEPALLVCPTSVLGNWEHEIRRFAPDLKMLRHHGRGRASEPDELARQLKKHQVVMTTYVIARMDEELLSERTWSHLIIDEAQNIKNPSAQQAQAIRAIPAERRMALTGTPVENRLTELWSILEFANPGLLGPISEFQRRFSVPIERFGSDEAAEKLRKLVSPFILRRVKSDPSIIQDLPDKQEYKVFCTLTREQATLYQAAVDTHMQRIESSDGIQRRGNILALLTALKQICNHPRHFLKDDDGSLSGRSGKLNRLAEMMEEVVAEGEHALIFTQYKEMGDLLVTHLEKMFELEIPFIHGGVRARTRDDIVGTFQNDPDASPALVLSLKAGGTGLNLTRATHVFHFDRWWNPAVEDQATDRAYRVGQTENVQVHKLVSTGTVEEKIDEILESKRDLADKVVSSGESWITELEDDDLHSLFSLGTGAAIDDDVVESPA